MINFKQEIEKLQYEVASLEMEHDFAVSQDNWSYADQLEAVIDCMYEDLILLEQGIVPESYNPASSCSDTNFIDIDDEFPF